MKPNFLRKTLAAILLLALTIAIVPEPAQAGCAHTCPRGFKYSDWVSQYIEGNKAQHRYARNVLEYCSACNQTMRTFPEYRYEDHSFNSNNYCKVCNYYRGCPHRHTRVEKDNTKCQYYSAKEHITKGSITYYCNDCKKYFDRNVQQNREPHRFGTGAKCSKCGYGMVLLETPAPTKRVCAHKNLRSSVVSSQISPKDASYHTVYEMIQEKCGDCGEIIRTQEKPRQEAHTIKDGACSACGALLSCQHKSEKTDATVIAATPNRDGTHTLQRLVTRICADCALVLGSEMQPQPQPHTYANETCLVCGAPRAEMKPLQNTVEITVNITEITEITNIISEMLFLDMGFIEMMDIDVLPFELFAARPFGSRGSSSNSLPKPGEEADFGFLIAGLQHPYGLRGKYVMREGEQAALYAMYLKKDQDEEANEEGGTKADTATSATEQAQDGIDSEEASEQAIYLFQQEDIELLKGENFDWKADGNVRLEGSGVTAGEPGQGTITLLPKEGFTIVGNGADTVSVMTCASDDPYLWFIDKAFVQDNLPLLENGERQTLAASFGNLYYDPAGHTFNGAYISRLPISFGIVMFPRGEPDQIVMQSIPSFPEAPGALEHFGETLSPVRPPIEEVYVYAEDAPGKRTEFSLPLDGLEFFAVTLPWNTPVSIGTNMANLLTLSLLGTPQGAAVYADIVARQGDDINFLSFVDTLGLGNELANEMCVTITPEELIGNASPARGVFAKIANGEAAAPLIEASKKPPESRDMSMVLASGSAADQFAILAEELYHVFGINAVDLMSSYVVPELLPALESVELFSDHNGRAQSVEEVKTIVACIDMARIVDETWGMDNLVTAFISEDLEEDAQ